MTIYTMEEMLRRVLTTSFEMSEDAVGDDAVLSELGLDSLAVAELTDTLSTELGAPLSDDVLHPTMTVEQAVNALRKDQQ